MSEAKVPFEAIVPLLLAVTGRSASREGRRLSKSATDPLADGAPPEMLFLAEWRVVMCIGSVGSKRPGFPGIFLPLGFFGCASIEEMVGDIFLLINQPNCSLCPWTAAMVAVERKIKADDTE